MDSHKIRLRPQPRTELRFGEHLDVHIKALPDYEGPLDVVPSDQRQVLPFEGRSGTADVVVEAIPSNWGRIIYDGSVITIV